MRTAEMFQKLDNCFRRFIYFSADVLYLLCIIFAIFTHLYDIFDEVPYLGIFGPRNKGKSRLGIILFFLCFNPIKSEDISDAALYRGIKEQMDGTTMIIDEADALSRPRRGSILLNILRSGNRRDGKIIRTGPGGTTENFPTFCPKIIINIKGISDLPLQTRTIPIYMVKRTGSLERFRFKKVEKEFEELKKLIKSFCDYYKDIVSQLYFSFQGVEGISDRDEEIWAPLLIIADLLATLLDTPSIRNQMIELAKGTILERQRSEMIGNRDLQILVSTRDFLENTNPLNSEGLYVAEELRDFIKKSWGSAGLTTEAVGRVLNRNGVIKDLKRPNLTPKGGSAEKVQKTCYILDGEALQKLTDEYFGG
jgi:hypothetical protein